MVSQEKFPKVFAWISRFDRAIENAKKSGPKVTTLKGAEAIQRISQADFCESEGLVDDDDPLGLKKGDDVESWPIDSGFKHHDRGKLVSINAQEVVLATQSKVGGKEIRVHHPRWNFRTRLASGQGAKL